MLKSAYPPAPHPLPLAPSTPNSAQHRLVLSGTPIQNSALELWGLFDFLMPGFLGGAGACASAGFCEWWMVRLRGWRVCLLSLHGRLSVQQLVDSAAPRFIHLNC